LASVRIDVKESDDPLEIAAKVLDFVGRNKLKVR